MDRTGIGLLLVYLLCVSTRVLGQGNVNIALGKTYSQISLYDNTRPASHAANGNWQWEYNENNCIHTGGNPDPFPTNEFHWWQVDLGRTYPVHGITLWDREGHTLRLYPCIITVDGRTCVTVPESEAPTGVIRFKHVACASVIYGQRVRLTLQRLDEFLNLCEFQMFVPSGVSQCPAGHHGAQCGQTCSDNCGGGPGKNFCYQDTGVCYDGCVGNFTGDFCQDCKEENYGSNCDSTCYFRCAGGCARDNGYCTSCDIGFWGSYFCQQPCPANCAESYCQRANGYCYTCKPGVYRNQCDTRCDQFTPGCALCTRQGVCTSCKTGYTGLPCTECADGFHGDKCDLWCSTILSYAYTQCTQCTQDGRCTACSNNFQAPSCTDCASGYYKTNNRCYQCSTYCKDRQCNSTTGKCDGCNDGRYGYTCDSTCGDGCARCDQDLGNCRACTANTNLKFPGCTECESGLYGEGCSETCGNCQVGTTCHHEDGHCPGGCVAEFTGPLCLQEAKPATSTENKVNSANSLVGPIVGAIVGVGLVLTISLTAAVCWRRKSAASRSSGQDPPNASPISMNNLAPTASPEPSPLRQSSSNEDHPYSEIRDPDDTYVITEMRSIYDKPSPYSNEDGDREPCMQLTSQTNDVNMPASNAAYVNAELSV